MKPWNPSTERPSLLMATNTILPVYPEWFLPVLEKLVKTSPLYEAMLHSTPGPAEKLTGESFTLPAQDTDSTTCGRPDAKTSFTSGSLEITNGTLKSTPESEAAIAELTKTFVSTISSRMEQEMMTTCGCSNVKESP